MHGAAALLYRTTPPFHFLGIEAVEGCVGVERIS